MKKGWLIGCGIAGILGIGLCAGAGVLVYSGVKGIIALTQPVVDASEVVLSRRRGNNQVAGDSEEPATKEDGSP